MALTITGLSKTYPNGVQALKNLSLTIGNNMFGLLGPNGAGKSTLMRTVATLQDPDSGSITLDGIDVLKQKNEIRKVLGYLPQEFGVYPKMSATDMLMHLAVLKGIASAGERKEMVEALLQQTNLWDARKKSLSTYSGGMKQRFGIAQALLANPKLIIVDEPTAGLDPAERNRFLNLRDPLHPHRRRRPRTLPAYGYHRLGRSVAGGFARRCAYSTARENLEQGRENRR
jgi:ABC-2 type transport system ATP-binding protein